MVRTVVRDDWMVRKGVVRKEATMVVTPNVVVGGFSCHFPICMALRFTFE